MELDFAELRELLAVINQTDVAEFSLKSGDFELLIRKGVQPPDRLPPAMLDTKPDPLPALPSVPPAPAAPASSPPPAVPSRGNDRLAEIVSLMVGTFYRAPAPDEAPFVDVGDRVRSGQTVCIVEAMKLMNEIESEVSGEIVEILVQNGEPVEYGQPLMRVRPD